MPGRRKGTRMRVRVLGLLGCASLLFAVIPQADATTNTERTAESWIINQVNIDRAAMGLPTLLENNGLRAGAESHSQWLRDNKYGSKTFYGDPHDGFDGRYAAFTSSDPGAGGFCENVAMVGGKAYDHKPKKAARALYKLWVDALDGHNQCLFDKQFPYSPYITLHTRVVGVGIVKQRHRWYATYDAGEDSSPSA